VTAPSGRGRRAVSTADNGLRMNSAEADLLKTELEMLIAELERIELNDPLYQIAGFRRRVLNGLVTRIGGMLGDDKGDDGSPTFD
jgi:hypothetical protein